MKLSIFFASALVTVSITASIHRRSPIETSATLSKFILAVCEKKTEIYEGFLNQEEILEDAKHSLKKKRKSEEESDAILIDAYTRFMKELGKGKDSRYCNMKFEGVGVSQLTVKFSDGTYKQFEIVGEDSDFRIMGGVLDLR